MAIDQVVTVGTMKINDGQLDEFKTAVHAMVAQTEANEPNNLSYQYYFNADETECTLVQILADSQALLDHLAISGEVIDAALKKCRVTDYTVFGELSHEAAQAVTRFGAVIHHHFAGFTR